MLGSKIAIYHPEGNISSNPSLSALCTILAENGFTCDLWSLLNSNNIDLSYNEPGVNLHLVQSFDDLTSSISAYDFIIGIDSGIIAAKKTANILGVPYGFISYEIFYDDELSGHLITNQKAKERAACLDISFAIVQDKVRAADIIKEYSVDPDKIVHIPVAGAGLKEYNPSFYLHDHLNLSKDIKILLHMGSVASWTLTEWAINNADSLPDDWVLVIHSRTGSYSTNTSHRKVYYSNLPTLSLDEMHQLICSATCTLAIYNPDFKTPFTGKNLQNMGLSSGKIATSLQHGVPVALSHMGEMSDLIQIYEAGVLIDKESPTPFSALSGLTDFDQLRSNSWKLFSEKLDLRLFADQILDRINSSISKKSAITVDTELLEDNVQHIMNRFNEFTIKGKIHVILRMLTESVKQIFGKIF